MGGSSAGAASEYEGIEDLARGKREGSNMVRDEEIEELARGEGDGASRTGWRGEVSILLAHWTLARWTAW